MELRGVEVKLGLHPGAGELDAAMPCFLATSLLKALALDLSSPLGCAAKPLQACAGCEDGAACCDCPKTPALDLSSAFSIDPL